MRGYSGKATKWVDFVKAGSTQRKREEPCPKETVRVFGGSVKSFVDCGGVRKGGGRQVYEGAGALPQGTRGTSNKRDAKDAKRSTQRTLRRATRRWVLDAKKSYAKDAKVGVGC